MTTVRVPLLTAEDREHFRAELHGDLTDRTDFDFKAV